MHKKDRNTHMSGAIRRPYDPAGSCDPAHWGVQHYFLQPPIQNLGKTPIFLILYSLKQPLGQKP
jgi:hypothetical protein